MAAVRRNRRPARSTRSSEDESESSVEREESRDITRDAEGSGAAPYGGGAGTAHAQDAARQPRPMRPSSLAPPGPDAPSTDPQLGGVESEAHPGHGDRDTGPLEEVLSREVADFIRRFLEDRGHPRAPAAPEQQPPAAAAGPERAVRFADAQPGDGGEDLHPHPGVESQAFMERFAELEAAFRARLDALEGSGDLVTERELLDLLRVARTGEEAMQGDAALWRAILLQFAPADRAVREHLDASCGRTGLFQPPSATSRSSVEILTAVCTHTLLRFGALLDGVRAMIGEDFTVPWSPFAAGTQARRRVAASSRALHLMLLAEAEDDFRRCRDATIIATSDRREKACSVAELLNRTEPDPASAKQLLEDLKRRAELERLLGGGGSQQRGRPDSSGAPWRRGGGGGPAGTGNGGEFFRRNHGPRQRGRSTSPAWRGTSRSRSRSPAAGAAAPASRPRSGHGSSGGAVERPGL